MIANWPIFIEIQLSGSTRTPAQPAGWGEDLLHAVDTCGPHCATGHPPIVLSSKALHQLRRNCAWLFFVLGTRCLPLHSNFCKNPSDPLDQRIQLQDLLVHLRACVCLRPNCHLLREDFLRPNSHQGAEEVAQCVREDSSSIPEHIYKMPGTAGHCGRRNRKFRWSSLAASSRFSDRPCLREQDGAGPLMSSSVLHMHSCTYTKVIPPAWVHVACP